MPNLTVDCFLPVAMNATGSAAILTFTNYLNLSLITCFLSPLVISSVSISARAFEQSASQQPYVIAHPTPDTYTLIITLITVIHRVELHITIIPYPLLKRRHTLLTNKSHYLKQLSHVLNYLLGERSLRGFSPPTCPLIVF